ncbi:MAG TPA: dihydrofolate reductase family protein [Pyrinomonadaceae bacterium]|nr:dihydrofolate reductase family protein [Pyrinomonadaceae bacterium]
MRKVTFGGANSLDNFIARPDGAVDWLMWGEEAGEIMKDFWQNIDTMVMGRKTWDVALANSPKPKEGSANPYGDIKTYVFSRTLEAGDQDGAIILNDDAGEFVRSLKTQDGKDICVMGGGELARDLFEAGVIDEIGFNIHPVLLGKGIPLFHTMTRQIDLELLECRPFKNGCVYVLYRVL